MDVGELLGMSNASFSHKLNGKSQFTLGEVVQLNELLKLDKNDFFEIFLSN